MFLSNSVRTRRSYHAALEMKNSKVQIQRRPASSCLTPPPLPATTRRTRYPPSYAQAGSTNQRNSGFSSSAWFADHLLRTPAPPRPARADDFLARETHFPVRGSPFLARGDEKSAPSRRRFARENHFPVPSNRRRARENRFPARGNDFRGPENGLKEPLCASNARFHPARDHRN